jgi:hypothetical protein
MWDVGGVADKSLCRGIGGGDLSPALNERAAAFGASELPNDGLRPKAVEVGGPVGTDALFVVIVDEEEAG